MKTFTGTVISNKMQNTVVVEREFTFKHPLLKKIIRRTRRLKARTSTALNIGDFVKIGETKPFAKSVYFSVIEKIQK